MAAFDSSGAALELPEHLVPPQYREWDVQARPRACPRPI